MTLHRAGVNKRAVPAPPSTPSTPDSVSPQPEDLGIGAFAAPVR